LKKVAILKVAKKSS